MSKDLLSMLNTTSSKSTKIPEWVNKKNKSYLAFIEINKLLTQKSEYINKHSKITQFKKKSNFQISISELARAIDVSVPTLSATSTYSKDLMEYLKTVNSELLDEMRKKTRTYLESRSKGTKQKRKLEIAVELQRTKIELDNLKKRNAKNQATEILNNISLPIKRLLGLDC